MTISSPRLLLATALSLAIAAPAAAQKAKPAAPAAQKTIVGMWAGTATVPMPDSAIVVPVFYTFADGPSGMGGTAMVPGQGSGPISNVVRDGATIRFRVTVTQKEKQAVLEHDGKVGADGAIEGMVNMDNKPIAKFRILQKAEPKK